MNVPYKQASKAVIIDGNEHALQGYWQSFSDKILLIITPNGRIGQMISVDLGRATKMPAMLPDSEGFGMLPNTHLTPHFRMGSSTDARADMTSLLAVQIGSMVVERDPTERRTLLLGITLPGSSKFWDTNSGGEAAEHDTDDGQRGRSNEEEKRALFLAVMELAASVRI